MDSVLFFSVGELFGDLMLALKLFALLSVVSFVFSHLGKGPLSYALVGGLSWFVLFDYWKFFGGIFVLYSLLAMGVSGILIDFFFVSGMGGGGGEEASPVDSSMDLLARQRQLQNAHQIQAKMGGMAGANAPGGTVGARPPPGGQPGRPGGGRPMGR